MSKKLCTFILILFFVLSAFLTTVFFKPGDIFSNTPIYTDDYSMHFSQCISARRFLSSYGKCWGYDPFFLAGFPRGVLHPDIMLWQFFYFALSPVLGEGFAFKLYVLLFLVLYPFCIYGAARNFNFSREISLIASALAILFFHSSFAIGFVYWGMVSYVIVCFFSIYVFSLFYRLFEGFSWKRYVFATVGASLLFLMHVLALIHIFIPILLLYGFSVRKLTRFQHVMVLLIPCIVAGFNSFWLILVAEFFHHKTTRPENYEFTLQIKNVFEAFKVYIMQKRSIDPNVPILNNTFFEVILLLFGCCGFYLWYKKRQLSLLVPFLGGVVFIFVVAYFGSHTPFFAQFQPQRFTIPLSLLLVIPASAGVFVVMKDIFYQRNAVSVAFILCVVFVLLYRPVIRPFGIFYKYKVWRLNCEFPDQLHDLLNFIENHTTREGRILIEDSESRKDSPAQYYGGHFPALFPEYVKREYLCGPRPMYPIKHSYASFTEGVLFEKDIKRYTQKNLRAAFNTYNVKWIVCWSEESNDFFNQFPEYITRMAEIDIYTVYKVNRKASFFLKGSGAVRSDYNRLELRDIVPEDGEVIIAYHWMKNLKTVPEMKIERVFLAGDPVGFIKIRNPAESLVLVNDY